MFLDFLYRLRDHGIPVGAQEAIALAQALSDGVHDDSVDGFYYAARAILVHHERHLDAFDQAFLAQFAGVTAPLQIKDEMREWLNDEQERRDDSEVEQQEMAEEQIEELKRRFEERLREQTERHDGGSYWVGTAGTSPFGRAGAAQAGIRAGDTGGSRSAVHVADARQYRGYRSDVALDIRQMEVALRRLRAFVREGADVELDIESTIDETARNGGEIEIVTRPPSRPNTHVILMIDVGGSMYPYARLMSQLFSATRKATHFKELRSFYFHNCVYGKVYETDRFTDPKWLHDLMRECGSHYKLIMVGDALMAPYELMSRGGGFEGDRSLTPGLEWLHVLRDHFTDSVWLNPERESRWPGTTIEEIGRVFPMFPMTVDGLTEAMAHLNRGVSHRR